MKKILSALFLLFVVSCAGSSGGEAATAPTNPSPVASYVLKINTLLYDNSTGVSSGENADNLVSISLGTSSLKKYAIEELNKGIKIAKNADVSVKITSPDGGNYKNKVLWLGVGLEDEDMMKSDSIEFMMDKDISIILISSKDSKVQILETFLSLSVVGPGLVSVADNVYEEGNYKLNFVYGQKVALETIFSGSDILFSGYTKPDGQDTNSLIEIAMNKDIPITASFINTKTAKYIVKIPSIPTTDGKVFVNDSPIESGKEYSSERMLGEKIRLKAEASSGKLFLGWSDNINGSLTANTEYEYTVSSDAEISPTFAAGTGVIALSISPKTNFFTTESGGSKIEHTQNLVEYGVYDGTKLVKSTTGFSKGNGKLPPLSWVNNTVSDLKVGQVVKFEAIAGEGFYDKTKDPDGSKIRWSSAITGTGIEKEIKVEEASKVVNVLFEREKRNVTIAIGLKNYSAAVNGFGDEASSNDAKGYTVIINKTNIFKDMTDIQKTFDWHNKIDVEVISGTHYSNVSIKNDSSSNPEEGYNALYGKDYKVTKISFDLESNITNEVVLNHKRINMTLNVRGGDFGPEADSKYKSFVSLFGSGDSTSDIKYWAETYNNGVAPSSYHTYAPIPVLSGIPVNLFANTTDATVFKGWSVLGGSIVTDAKATNAKVQNIGNDFSISGDFVSPIYKLSIGLRGMLDAGGTSYVLENITNKVADYGFSISSKPNSSFIVNSQFDLTNGIPVVVTAKSDLGGHYKTLLLADEDVAEKTIILSNDKAINIDFLHLKRKMKLNIYGGNDDRNKSHVKIYGTGIDKYNTTYYAKNRNVSLDDTVTNKAEAYEFEALSGITNRLKIEAYTSSVHNFHKIVTLDNSMPLSAVGEVKWGSDTFNTTNTSIVNIVPAKDDNVIEVYFRINSLQGARNGIPNSDTDYGAFAIGKIKAEPKIENNVAVYEVYTANQLYDLSEQQPSFVGQKIRLMRDIYIAKNPNFRGFSKEFRGAFYGNKFVIFDASIGTDNSERTSFFSSIVNGYVNGLTLSRGRIWSGGVSSSVGVIGYAKNSALSYITNALSEVGNNRSASRIGGIIGFLDVNNNIQYLGNYANVMGNDEVGGVIGGVAHDKVGNNHRYLYNRGNVSGNSKVGGVIGGIAGEKTSTTYDDNFARFQYVYNTGNVKAESEYSGGIAGYTGFGDFQFIDVYNIGTVDGPRSGGFIGYVLGRREVKDHGGNDEERTSYPLKNGYNIGKMPNGEAGAIFYEAGYKTGLHGKHYLDNNDVYSIKPETSEEFVYRGVQEKSGDGWYAGTAGPRRDVVVFYTEHGKTYGDSIFNNANSIIGLSKDSLGSGNLRGFSDGSVWKMTTTANAGDYNLRPTFLLMPEEELPAWLKGE